MFTLKIWQRSLILLGMLSAVHFAYPADQVSAKSQFTDIKGYIWAEDGINYLSKRGTIAGYGNGIFKPANPITRAQAITYLIREMYPNRDIKAADIHFRDLPVTHPFYAEMAKAAEIGLIAGFEDGTIRPDAPISRAETAAILARQYRMEHGDKVASLPDIQGHWGKEPVDLLASNGLIGGYPDGTFKPNRPVSRAEFAVFLTRVIRFERQEAISAQNWDELIRYMTLDEKAGQMLMPDLRMWKGKPTYSLNGGVTEVMDDQQPGGFIVFDKNITDAKQLTTFTDQLQKAAGDIPLLVGIDQEGGVVKRIPGGTNLPGNMALGATGQPELAKQAGKVTGTELSALGINLNFAPVLDVNINPDNPIIGIRSFGSDPGLVSEFGVNMMQGLQQSGVIAAVKHFPGHGDTSVDSHLGLPVVYRDRQRLDAVELKPFKEAIQNGAEMVMSSHIAFPALDDTTVKSKKDGSDVHLPATLSKKIMTGLLRNELGFQGVVISDAFTMEGIAEHFGENEAVKLAVAAGVDVILMPDNIEGAHRTIVNAVKGGDIDEKLINDSVIRILKLKQKYGLFAPQEALETKLAHVAQTIGSSSHRQIEQRIAESAVTELVNGNQLLPFRLNDGDVVTVIAPTGEQAKRIEAGLKTMKGSKKITIETVDLKESSRSEINSAVTRGDAIILASYYFRSTMQNMDWNAYQELIDSLNGSSKPYVLLSMGNPYELMHLKNVKAAIAAYGAETPNIDAAMKVVLGIRRAEGTLPVSTAR